MAVLNDAVKRDLIQQLNAERDAYLETFNRIHEALIQQLGSSQNGSSTNFNPSPRQPSGSITSSVTAAVPPIVAALRRQNGSVALQQDGESLHPRSVFSSGTGDDDEDSDDEASFFVQQHLPEEESTEDALRLHMKQHHWDDSGKKILGPLLDEKWYHRNPQLLWNETTLEKDGSLNEASQVYEVGEDGSALPLRQIPGKNFSQAIWHAMTNVNLDPSKRQAVGQIAIIREPSRMLFGAVHHALNPHFDMDEIFRILSDHSPTRAYMRGCYDEDPRQQRSFVFALKYYTIVGENRKPAEWQSADLELRSSETHIPIADCSSVIALSLTGKPVDTVRSRSRKKAHRVGHIYDPFAPWRVLNIQCYPDWKHTVDAHETNRHYVNGPEAFLSALLVEYRDAKKRFLEINKRIMALATPSSEFMFKEAVRDLLLFEDDKYTYSRRYFWAFQTLAIMNDRINDMINAYRETFTDDVWTGKNKMLWPGTEDRSSKFKNFRKRMAHTRREFEHEIRELERVRDQNNREQDDIRNLREQLFSGTSVLETRKSLEQGQNIKLLTLVSIFFLPLTFVTSIFGMTNMPQNDNFNRFAIVTVCICMPTYLMIGSLNHSRGVRWWQNRTRDVYQVFIVLCVFLWKYIIRDPSRAEDYRVLRAQLKEERAVVENSEEEYRQRAHQRRLTRSQTSFDVTTAKNNVSNSNDKQGLPTEPRPSLQTLHHRHRNSSIKFEEPKVPPSPRNARMNTFNTTVDLEKLALSAASPSSSDPGPLARMATMPTAISAPPPLITASSYNGLSATPVDDNNSNNNNTGHESAAAAATAPKEPSQPSANAHAQHTPPTPSPAAAIAAGASSRPPPPPISQPTTPSSPAPSVTSSSSFTKRKKSLLSRAFSIHHRSRSGGGHNDDNDDDPEKNRKGSFPV